MKTIPIVFATDEGYAIPTRVAIASILAHKAEDVYVDIYVLVPKLGGGGTWSIFNDLQNAQQGFRVQFVEMGNRFQDMNLYNSWPAPSYYRLCIAEILTQYEKCLYLDGDIFVRKDLWELYSIELGDNYVAGVKDPCVMANMSKSAFAYTNEIGMPYAQFMKGYINSGVLVMNLSALRKNRIGEYFAKLCDRKSVYPDQDIINAACCGHIVYISPCYNRMEYFLDEQRLAAYPKCFTDKELYAAQNDPVVIHYTGVKPWRDPGAPCALYWWEIIWQYPLTEQIWTFLSGNLSKYTNRFYRFTSFRVGRAVTWLPRTALGVIKKIRNARYYT